jgi:hypothetical protein
VNIAKFSSVTFISVVKRIFVVVGKTLQNGLDWFERVSQIDRSSKIEIFEKQNPERLFLRPAVFAKSSCDELVDFALRDFVVHAPQANFEFSVAKCTFRFFIRGDIFGVGKCRNNCLKR